MDDFAAGLVAADHLSPTWKAYRPGIGPYAEDAAVRLTVTQMRLLRPGTYDSAAPVPYPSGRLVCDLGIGMPIEWAIEVKMARLMGDNGKLDASAVKDVLSPYDADRSALSDVAKLQRSAFTARKAVLVYGFDYPARPLPVLIRALDILLRASGLAGEPCIREFDGLVHPVHRAGAVVAWEVTAA